MFSGSDLFQGFVSGVRTFADSFLTEEVNNGVTSADGSNKEPVEEAAVESKPIYSEEVLSWSVDDVCRWLEDELSGIHSDVVDKFRYHEVDGFTLLQLSEEDLRREPMCLPMISAIKRISSAIRDIKGESRQLSHKPPPYFRFRSSSSVTDPSTLPVCHCHLNEKKYAKHLKSEKFKALTAFLYAVVVLYICAVVMTIVNDRVPDMAKYPPLPDLFLDNVPYISWGFTAAEYLGLILSMSLLSIVFTHKHRFVIIRRYFSLGGTLYLLRAVCMLITSLSVPCKHFHCERSMDVTLYSKLVKAFQIVLAGGMSINGVRYCGDYMFSGHTTLLTLTNLFIDEYGHKDYPVIKTLGWVMNMFGIFFVMAGHEHYSIDVFIAFYLTTRLFLYYHTLADNHRRLRYDERRAWIYFPLFSYFEAECDGAVPYEFDLPLPKSLKSSLGFE